VWLSVQFLGKIYIFSKLAGMFQRVIYALSQQCTLPKVKPVSFPKIYSLYLF